MTKTFENGPHVAVTPAPTMPAAAAAPSSAAASTADSKQPPPSSGTAAVANNKVYNAIVSTSAASVSCAAAASIAAPNAANENNTTNSLCEEDSVTNLDELKLRSLLEEAINYKSPKDREGKSQLFKTLLIDAEDDLRKEHAHNASGPARHFSSTAKKRHRQRRQPSSVSVNLTHGGSLNDLAAQELYEAYGDTSAAATTSGALLRSAKTAVSTRQREGGSLPCNVNAGAVPHVDAAYFMEERARQLEQRSKQQRDKDALRLADHAEAAASTTATTATATATTTSTSSATTNPPMATGNFISKTSIAIAGSTIGGGGGGGGGGGSGSGTTAASGGVGGGNNVDDAMSFTQLTGVASLATHNADGSARTSLMKQLPMQHFGLVAKKDENDNALTSSTLSTASLTASATNNASAMLGAAAATTTAASGSSGAKRKSKQRKPSEKSTAAENIEGHRADIIGNIDKLVSYIEGTDEKSKAKKQLHKQQSHALGKDASEKSKRARKKSSSMLLQKSTSMEEMSTTKQDFHFEVLPHDAKEKAPLRNTKSNAERPSRHKAWGALSAEQQPVSTSAENLEIADFIYVTKKKKSKKRRNSLGSRNAQASERPAEFHSLRGACGGGSGSSPRRKSAGSAPHSDSSDNESLHSLPLDGDAKSQQISYADIAKCSERPKWNRQPPAAAERRKAEKPAGLDERKQPEAVEMQAPEVLPPIVASLPPAAPPPSVAHPAVACAEPVKEAPVKTRETDTDLSSLQNWPEIRNNKVNQAKSVAVTPEVNNVQPLQDWPSIISNGGKSLSANNAKMNDNKKKVAAKVPVAVPPPGMQSANEHLQQVLQVSNANASYIYRHNHNHQELHEEETVINNPQQVIQQVSEQHHLYQMPPNIRDVQSIEEMQMRSLQAAQMSPALAVDEECDDFLPHALPPPPLVQQHASVAEKHRPAVVILSSGGDRHSTSDITFGFGINEQLLSGDVCADFVSRFLQPDVTSQATTYLDQLVNYVGSDWEDIVMQTHTGKVKYYTDELS